ncbi:MAG: deoxyribose-phosphate aldolase [Firmicutes bacterium]|nr:deoxyribose-phosphate aldolase [Bacillota bacterium]
MRDILSKTDHTLLSPSATWEDIKKIADEGIKYSTASICIPPSFVGRAAAYTEGKVKVCTVIGFPNGYNTTAAKCFETEIALREGADEIDMVINIGAVKEQRYEAVLEEIRSIKNICGKNILKVIIECCALTEYEKLKMCEIVTLSGADFIKSSTGFGSGGATNDDVALMKKNVGENVKVKAAGGIKTLEDARKFIALGADRLGTSRIVALCSK